MAPTDNNIANIKHTRVYKLCRTCNLQGKKGNALVICTSCTKHVHSNNSCSTKLNIACKNNNNNDNSDVKYEHICNTCKAKRKSGYTTAPTTSTTSHRSIQSTSITRRRGSAPLDTTPSLASKYGNRRTTESGMPPTKQNSSCSTCTCNIPAHLDLQQQIDKINEIISE